MKCFLAGGLVAALAMVTSRPAGAYVQTVTDRMVPVRWPRSCVYLVAHTGAPPPNLTPELVLSAARAAAAAWSTPAVACTSWDLEIVEEATPTADAANDDKNNLVFRTYDWAYDPSALAITTVFAQQSDGRILDGDVEVNATTGRYRWGDLVAGTGTEGRALDLQNTLTHELGHLLGLDHNCATPGAPGRALDNAGNQVPRCDLASPEIQQATMFPDAPLDDVERRTLAPDDIAGVCAIYPASPIPSCSDAGMPTDGVTSDASGGDVPSASIDSPALDQTAPIDTTADETAPVASASSGHGGCSCAVGSRSGDGGVAFGLLLALVLCWRGRRPCATWPATSGGEGESGCGRLPDTSRGPCSRETSRPRGAPRSC